MSSLLALLEGGDLRSIGKANSVAKTVVAKPSLISDLIKGLKSEDPRVRMRAADALEKLCRPHPEDVARILFRWLHEDKSKIVQVCCLQTLTDLAQKDFQLKAKVQRSIQLFLKTGSPAVKARCRKLLKQAD